jgi:CDP-diacylglycerol--glycerol-3-phosphate 3-phosphatidyltransferase
MPSVYDLKPAFQRLLRPIVGGLAKAGIRPNAVTTFGIVLSFIAGALIGFWPTARWPLLALPVFLFVRMAVNAIDGMLARDHDMKSSLGAVLNEVGDVVSDTAMYLPLALVPGIPPIAICAIAAFGVITELAGVVGVQIGATRRYDGPMGKSDRAVVMGALALILGCGVKPGPWLPWVLGAICVLLALTVWNRCRRALRERAAEHEGSDQ